MWYQAHPLAVTAAAAGAGALAGFTAYRSLRPSRTRSAAGLRIEKKNGHMVVAAEGERSPKSANGGWTGGLFGIAKRMFLTAGTHWLAGLLQAKVVADEVEEVAETAKLD